MAGDRWLNNFLLKTYSHAYTDMCECTHAHTHTLIKGEESRKRPWRRLLGAQLCRLGLKQPRDAEVPWRTHHPGEVTAGSAVSRAGTFAQLLA